MSKSPQTGRLLRKIERLDREWRAGDSREGRAENALARELGRAASRSIELGRKARDMQNR
jgi:hypothetical protein